MIHDEYEYISTQKYRQNDLSEPNKQSWSKIIKIHFFTLTITSYIDV